MMSHVMVKKHRAYWKHSKGHSLKLNFLTGEHRRSFLDLNAWRAWLLMALLQT
uniref:Uncharacterized protein n=1 Tax=Arundo donax TaxID=35708 RepID=A0A0A9EGN9_ARUDO